jgi:DNA-binding MarR family transcriptional regulator
MVPSELIGHVESVMEHIGNGQLMISASPMRRRVAVHPGWFTSDRLILEEQLEPAAVENTRFATLSQLLRTAGALDRAAAEVLADLGLTAGAFFALLELSAASPMGLAPSELARRLAVARRTATLYVDILTRQGWVERMPHPVDRRMVLANLTEAGHALVDELSTAYKRRLSDLIRELSPGQSERLRQLLTQIPVGPQPDSVLDCD